MGVLLCFCLLLPLLRSMSDNVLHVQYMTEASWNWRMMKYIFTELHVYDEQQNYVPFDWEKEEPFYMIQRKVLPNTM